MTGTDPAKFDPETTGVFKAVPLAEAMRPGDDGAPPSCGWNPANNAPLCDWSADCEVHGQNAPTVLPQYTYPPVQQAAVSLLYAHSDGQTFTRVDVENGLTHPSGDGDDNVHRERLLLRAVLEHTLAMLKGEDVS